MNSKTKVLGLASVAALATAGIAVGASTGDISASFASKIDSAKPKNVILLVGDGMGDSEVTSARFYGKGVDGRLRMDELPFRGSATHVVLNPGPGPDYTPNYVGDSAPTAVNWSTGKRTVDGRLAQGPSSAASVPGSNEGYTTYMELARAAGKATGNVSTAEITDATPGGPTAHISQRACQGPEDTRTLCPTEAKTAGGLGSIAEQTVDAGYDVVLGGGKRRWQQPLQAGGTENVIDYASTKGYTQQVGDKAGLDAITSLDGGKVLGLFNQSNMTTEFAPLYARTDAYLSAQAAAGTLDPQVNGGSDTTRCDETQRSKTDEPSIADMTTKAIQLLEKDPQGFTLQVEGASIDKRDHAADICGQIGELLAFDKAIGVALDYQKTHPDTLVLVTADHAHTSQIGYADAKPASGASYGTVQTVDGAPLRIVYGTADTGDGATTSGSQQHTGAQVPLWGSGPQAANVQGTHDQTDIFAILNGFAPSATPAATPTVKPTPAPTSAPTPKPTTAPVPVPTKLKVVCKARRSSFTCKVTVKADRGQWATLYRNGRRVAKAKVSRGGDVKFRAKKGFSRGKYRVEVSSSARSISLR